MIWRRQALSYYLRQCWPRSMSPYGVTRPEWITHEDVIKWKHFPRNWPFVRGIHRSPVNSPHKGQWRGALMFTLICARINGWVNNREAGDLRRYRPHYDVIVMVRLRMKNAPMKYMTYDVHVLTYWEFSNSVVGNVSISKWGTNVWDTFLKYAVS